MGKGRACNNNKIIPRSRKPYACDKWDGDIPWSVKQEIKNELFGSNRTAIEVFPKDKNLVDVVDVYHLWIFSKDFEMPFGIHPTKDKQPRTIQRGCPKDPTRLIENYKQYNEEHKDVMGENLWIT